MTVTDLIKELKAIVKIHPEAKDAYIWAVDFESHVQFPISYIGYDKKKHKPARMKLEK